MNTRRKPVIDPSRLFNPFINDQESIKGRSWVTNKRVFTTDQEGNNLQIGSIANESEIEDQTYTRIYQDADYRQFILNLSYPATKLYVYLTFKLPRNQDYLWINTILFKRESSLDDDQYLLAVEELERYGVIAYTIYKDVYYINPLIFYCGNRLKKYTAHVKMR